VCFDELVELLGDADRFTHVVYIRVYEFINPPMRCPMTTPSRTVYCISTLVWAVVQSTSQGLTHRISVTTTLINRPEPWANLCSTSPWNSPPLKNGNPAAQGVRRLLHHRQILPTGRQSNPLCSERLSLFQHVHPITHDHLGDVLGQMVRD